MAHGKPEEGKVSAFPTKAFFVHMLTRDIELHDAILDLLDNCIDGVLRTNRDKGCPIAADDKAYEGYWAAVEFDEKRFAVSDNCGGIPRKLAEEHAFRLGSPDLERDKDLATVGIYGIGMKRAIFKMGRSCTVTTYHGKEAFKVTVTPEWLDDDSDWHLPLDSVDGDGSSDGTVIEIGGLHDTVRQSFSAAKSTFSAEFKKI